MEKFLKYINDKKIELYAKLPEWYRNWKYGEYGIHVISGVVLYIFFMLINMFVGFNNIVPLIIIVLIALVVELLSELRVKGTGDIYDFLATIIIPFMIYMFIILN